MSLEHMGTMGLLSIDILVKNHYANNIKSPVVLTLIAYSLSQTLNSLIRIPIQDGLGLSRP